MSDSARPGQGPGRAGARRRLKPLLLTSKYFLMGEIMTACDRLGVAHRLVSVPDDESDPREYVVRMFNALNEFRPDFVLTTNHMGVDREGVLASMLARLGVPLASWFVDNPHLVLDAYQGRTTAVTAVFTWDADHMTSLGEMGFAKVAYLPLATDERRFVPREPYPEDHPFRARVSFLGNSMAIKSRLRLLAAGPPPGLRAAYGEIAKVFGRSPGLSVSDCIRRDFPELAGEYESLTDVVRRLAFDTLIMWEATGQYRRECVEKLLVFTPLIAGDPGWLEVLPGEGRAWRYHKELAYYTETPLFYPAAEINFNATSRQMKGAVNQRVFDVPACGAFLLTDRTAQLETLFAPGKEVAVYSHPDEIAGLARFYLDHPSERQAIAKRGRSRALAEHTYVQRLTTLFDTMRDLV